MAEAEKDSGHHSSNVPRALSRTIHMGIPIASVLVILAFAAVMFQPPYKGNLPTESTLIFIPVYLTIVVVLVFGSMYLFKRLMDTEGGTYTGR